MNNVLCISYRNMSKNNAFLHFLPIVPKAYLIIPKYLEGFTKKIKTKHKLKIDLNVNLDCELSLTA